ncbi:hypothetical protein BT96DRAFT_981682 [Gymnopus androsaceus JB14]|uniref:Family A G protein-coupled receptor-like protein n=1 Tax=Gymnopus androsaceus JB14 TaxID=1447944 RepID=A0A6A4GLQ5_9AGAR|nr:hypothetical protein BT96DRAFT_981682 [Gymnopus androsaceus JB14]
MSDSCPEDAICIFNTTNSALQQSLYQEVILPVATELLLYGIFLVLFSLSIYVFCYRFTPGKLYIVATCLFFILATVSIVLDLVFRHVFLAILVTTIGSDSRKAVMPSFYSLLSALDYIFLVSGFLGDVILVSLSFSLAVMVCWLSTPKLAQRYTGAIGYGTPRGLLLIIPLLGVVISLVNEVLEQQQFKRAEQFAGQFDPFEQLDQPSFVNIANSNVCKIYIAITFTQNTILTGMIGKLNMHITGRLWWLNYKINKMPGGQSSQSASPNLLGPMLESGLLTPAFLLVWLVLNWNPETAYTQWIAFLSPCVLTQIVGIASTLIVVRIGLGVDALSSAQPYHTLAEDAENQLPSSDLATDNYNESNEIIIMSLREPELQPFQLKYDQPIEDFPSMTYHTLSATRGSHIQKLVKPHPKGKYAKRNK